jgi:hypothetical protein
VYCPFLPSRVSYCTVDFEAIDGMLLDILAAIARKDYEGPANHRCVTGVVW